MSEHKRYDRAMAFCRQAALLEPNAPYAYDQALTYAELAQDVPAMEWAAGNLVKTDWPDRNRELQAKARQKLEALSVKLDGPRADEARRLRETVQTQGRRDLVIMVRWQGEANVNVRVEEPTGSVCSPQNRQTLGGGVFVGDTIGEGGDRNTQTYLNALAFPGAYKVTAERVYGRPLGDEVQITVIRNQGTPQETVQIKNLPVKEKVNRTVIDGHVVADLPVLEVNLAEGRRTEAAYVPPVVNRVPIDANATAVYNPDRVMNQLRAMADPQVTGFEMPRGGTYSPGVVTSGGVRTSMDLRKDAAGDGVLYQSRVNSFIRNTVDLQAQAVISQDRRSVRLSVTPVFNAATMTDTRPVVVNPVIPGGN